MKIFNMLIKYLSLRIGGHEMASDDRFESLASKQR